MGSSGLLEEEADKLPNTADDEWTLPKCKLPPPDEFGPVLTFVQNAVKEQHGRKNDTVPVASYRGIIEAFRFKNDLAMLRHVLLALRVSGGTLSLLTTSSTKHARLIHQVLRLNPFALAKPSKLKGGELSVDNSAVDYDLADAQLHLLVAIVSSKSVFLTPTLTCLWKMLTLQQSDAPFERYVSSL